MKRHRLQGYLTAAVMVAGPAAVCRSGTLVIEDSTLRNNPSDGFETPGYPGIFVLADGDPRVTNSTIE